MVGQFKSLTMTRGNLSTLIEKTHMQYECGVHIESGKRIATCQSRWRNRYGYLMELTAHYLYGIEHKRWSWGLPYIRGSFNGRTMVFGTIYLGSNPSLRTNLPKRKQHFKFSFWWEANQRRYICSLRYIGAGRKSKLGFGPIEVKAFCSRSLMDRHRATNAGSKELCRFESCREFQFSEWRWWYVWTNWSNKRASKEALCFCLSFCIWRLWTRL